MSEKKKMPHILHLVIFLFVLGLICAGLLALVNNITAPFIEKNKENDLENTFSQINVKNPVELKNQTLIDGVEKIYLGKIDDEECYVFQINSKNNFTTITTLVVISKRSNLILALQPMSGTPSFTTHGKDDAIANNDYNVVGRGENNYNDYFNSVSGATISSSSIKNSIRIAFEQLKQVKE